MLTSISAVSSPPPSRASSSSSLSSPAAEAEKKLTTDTLLPVLLTLAPESARAILGAARRLGLRSSPTTDAEEDDVALTEPERPKLNHFLPVLDVSEGSGEGCEETPRFGEALFELSM